MVLRRDPPTRMDPILGKVRRCPRCAKRWPDEAEWPEDREFFSTSGEGHWQTYCRACWAEIAAERRARGRPG